MDVRLIALWTRTFIRASPGQADYAFGLAETPQGGFIIVGQSSGWGLYLIQVGDNGDSLWTRVYGQGSSFAGYDIEPAPEGGYLIARSTCDFDWINMSYYWQTCYWKTDSSGVPTLQHSYPNAAMYGYDEARSVAPLANGGYIITGYTDSRGVGEDVEAVRINSAGGEVWMRQYGGSGDQRGYTGEQTADGGFTFAGRNGSQAYLFKTSSSGTLQSSRQFGGTGDETAYDMRETSDGGFILAGMTSSYGSGGHDAYLVKTDGAGSLQWSKAHGGAGLDYANSVVEISGGRYLLSGTTRSFLDPDGDLMVVAVDDTGHVEWSAIYGDRFQR